MKDHVKYNVVFKAVAVCGLNKIFLLLSLMPLLTIAPEFSAAFRSQDLQNEHLNGSIFKIVLTFSQISGIAFCKEEEDEELFSVDPEKVKSDFEGYFDDIERHLSECNIISARQVLRLAENKAEQYKSLFSREEKKRYKEDIASLYLYLDRKVDSLVNVNLAVLKEKGVSEAIEFRRLLSGQYGVPETKLATVDDAIMTGTSMDQMEKEDKIRDDAVQALDEGRYPSEIDDASVRIVAERLAKARADSIRIEEARQDSIARVEEEERRQRQIQEENSAKARSTLLKIEQLLGEGEFEEAHTVYKIYKPNLSQYLSAQEFESITNRVQTAYTGLKEKRDWASRYSRELLALADKGKGTDAYNGFMDKRADLEKYLVHEEYRSLESAVNEANEDYLKNLERTKSSVSRIEELLSGKKVEKAYSLYQKSKADIAVYLEKGVSDDLNVRVQNAYDTMQDKKKWALLYEKDIQSLIKKRLGTEANQKFIAGRADLEQYLNTHAFKELEADVAAADRDFKQNQTKCQASAAGIHAFLNEKKIEEAYAAFSRISDNLKHYLDGATYEKLASRVQESYRNLQDMRRWAAGMLQEINTLIEDRQGAEAYEKFRNERVNLKEYLDPKIFASLENNVNRAKGAYVSNQAKAVADVKNILSLLAKEMIEEAYASFQKEKDSLKIYMESDSAYSALRSKVQNEYNFLQGRKRWTAQYVRKINTLIERKEGEEALAVYQKEIAELKKYMTPQDFQSLHTSVVNADNEYKENQKKARFAADRINALLAQNETEKAYEAFQKVKSSLSHYLDDEQAFTLLNSKVQEAYNALQARRKQASQQTKKIYGHIERNEGVAAYSLFQANRADLKKNLTDQEFTSLETAVARAEKEFRQNGKKAESTASGIQALLSQKRVEDAYAAFDTSQADLKQYLDPPVYDSLKVRVEAAYGRLQDKQKWALQQHRTINDFIQQREGRQAYSAFQREETELKKYLNTETFRALRIRVERANRDYAVQSEKAEKLERTLLSLVAKDSIDAAYTRFTEAKADLRHYLGEREFSELEERISKPLEQLRMNRAEAKSTVRRLGRMVRRKDVIPAYIEFQKEMRTLERYLSKEDFSAFRSQITKEYGDFMKNRQRAKITANEISSLIGRDKIEEASSKFKRSKSDLRIYLDQEAYSEISDRVRESYNELRQAKRSAKSFARELRGLIRKNEASKAYDGFRKNRSKLSKYLGKEEFKALESEINSAYRSRRSRSGKF